MANRHSVAASAVTIPTTTETVIATVGPFNENQANAQGINFDGNINITTGTSTTASRGMMTNDESTARREV